jgi:hypothetical protein
MPENFCGHPELLRNAAPQALISKQLMANKIVSKYYFPESFFKIYLSHGSPL